MGSAFGPVFKWVVRNGPVEVAFHKIPVRREAAGPRNIWGKGERADGAADADPRGGRRPGLLRQQQRLDQSTGEGTAEWERGPEAWGMGWPNPRALQATAVTLN